MSKMPATGARYRHRASFRCLLAAEKRRGAGEWADLLVRGRNAPTWLSQLTGRYVGKGQEVVHLQGQSLREQVASQRAAG